MYGPTFILLGLCTLNIVSSLQCYQCATLDYFTLDELDGLSGLGDVLEGCTDNVNVTCNTGEACATIPVLLEGSYWGNNTGRYELGLRARTCAKAGQSNYWGKVEEVGFESIKLNLTKKLQENYKEAGFESYTLGYAMNTTGKVETCSTSLCNKVAAANTTVVECYSCISVSNITTDGFSGAVKSKIKSLKKEMNDNCTTTTTCVSGAVCGKVPFSLKGSYKDTKNSGTFEVVVTAKKCVWEGQSSYSEEELDGDDVHHVLNIDIDAFEAKLQGDYCWNYDGFDMTKYTPETLETCNIALCNSATGTGKCVLYLLVAAAALLSLYL